MRARPHVCIEKFHFPLRPQAMLRSTSSFVQCRSRLVFPERKPVSLIRLRMCGNTVPCCVCGHGRASTSYFHCFRIFPSCPVLLRGSPFFDFGFSLSRQRCVWRLGADAPINSSVRVICEASRCHAYASTVSAAIPLSSSSLRWCHPCRRRYQASHP